MLFRNETTKVIKKARQTYAAQDAAPSPAPGTARPSRLAVRPSLRSRTPQGERAAEQGASHGGMPPSPVADSTMTIPYDDGGFLVDGSFEFGDFLAGEFEGLNDLVASASPSAPSLDPSVSGWWTPTGASTSPAGSVLDLLLPQPLPAVSTPLDELGKNKFDRHIVQRYDGPSQGSFSYVADLAGDPDSSRILMLGMQAVGLSGLANTNAGSHGMFIRAAQSNYSRALDMVNAALAGPGGEAQKDSTLLTIMLLGLYESTVCTSDDSVEAWSKHVNGVSALLASRGASQFQTPVGLQLFREAFSQLLFRTSVPVPPRLRLLRARAAKYVDAADPSWVMSDNFVEVMDLYKRVSPDHLVSTLAEDVWVLCFLLVFVNDRRLETTFDFSNLGRDWRYKTITDPVAKPELVYQGTYHVYYDLFVAKIWNSMRCCRIIANLLILAILCRDAQVASDDDFASGPYADVSQQATASLLKLRDEILASVPQMMGLVDKSTLSLGGDGEEDSTGARGPPVLGGYWLLWFLYLAGTLPVNSPNVRAWVIGALRAVRVRSGVQKAEYLAVQLELQNYSIAAPK